MPPGHVSHAGGGQEARGAPLVRLQRLRLWAHALPRQWQWEVHAGRTGQGMRVLRVGGGDEAPPSHVSRPPTDGDSTRTRNGLSFDPGLWHTNPIPAPPPAVTAVSPRLPETEAPCAADARGLQ